MMINYRVKMYFFFAILLLSCQETPKDKIQKEILQWQGKEVKFPQDITFTKFAIDTISYSYQDFKHKVLVYVDSTGCTPCKLKLDAWKFFIEEMDNLSKNSVGYLFYFADKNPKEIETMLRSENFDFPVVVDQKNQLNQLNTFSKDENFHHFLLDEQNRVKIVGNPIYNAKIKELYFSEIQKE